MKTFSIFAFICICVIQITWSQTTEPKKDNDIISLIVSGLGKDSESALKNAFKTSVENVINRVVDTKSIEKHIKILDSKVYKDTAAFIQSFEKLSDASENEGLFNLKIKITLNMKSLYQKLDEFQIPHTRIEGEKLYTDLLDKEDKSISSVQQMDDLLSELDMAKNLFTITLKNPNPKSIQKSENQVKAVFEFVIRIKQEPFYNEFVSKLEKVLDQYNIEQGKNTLQSDANFEKEQHAFVQYISWIDDKYLNKIGSEQSLILLNTRRNYNGDSLVWKWYIVDSTIRDTLIKHIYSPDAYLSYNTLKAKLDLLDENKQVLRSYMVSGDQLKPGQTTINFIGPGIGLSAFRGYRFFLLSPFMFSKDFFRYNDVWTSDIEIEMHMEELKRLKQIEAKLTD